MIDVLLADDHQDMRKAISGLLKGCADVRLVGEATSFHEVIDLTSQVRPDVVLMDLHMPDQQKVNPSELKSCLVNCQLLAMSLWTDQETKDLAKSFGAVGLLDKANLGTELLPSLKLCAQRRSAQSQQLQVPSD
jgi:two-component system invasion response regulator UvrY